MAFDGRGYRVGYGKGFYDRFLQGMDTLKVGLSLFDVSDNIDDVNEHDLKLDLCVTPAKLFDFRLAEE
jgi:5-formyltetrahydrofolate cyclo-ligase